MILDEPAVRRHLRMEDLIPAMARALADLSAAKVVQPGRRTPEEITLFKSVGVAVEDVVAADLVYRSARR